MTAISTRRAFLIESGAVLAAAAMLVVPAAPLVLTSDDEIAEIVRRMKLMPPMQRIWLKEQLYEAIDRREAKAEGKVWDCSEPNVLDGTHTPDQVWAVYDEWLRGFPQFVIDNFNSGVWVA